MKKVKIFISSPSDVIHERLIVQKVIARLNREFKDYLEIEGIFWEREPLVVTSDYQSLITKPSETDIVVVILWSRLGTALNPDEYKGKVTGKTPITGTEWEFEEAYSHFQLNNTPNILLYQKIDEDKPMTRDMTVLNEIVRQEELVKNFFEYWLINKEKGTFKAASHAFETSGIFEEIFEIHLRKELKKYLNESINYRANWHKGSPFRGLQSFDLEHSQVFFGRGKATNELRTALLKQIENNTAFLLILGASGSGKSSLVKAGLLPDLLLPGMVDNVAIARYTILKPSDNPSDLIEGLAKALMKESALPELKDNSFNLDNLTKHFKEATSLASHPIKQVLNQIAKKEKLTEIAKTKLIIVIDQFEEIFTLNSIDNEQRQKFVNLLSVLSHSGDVWIISTMRNDFYSNLDELPQLLHITQGYGRYSLKFPEEAEIGQIINKPAKESGVVFEINKQTGISLDEVLRGSAAKNLSSLPLLEYMLEQLWQKRTEKGILTYKAYEELGTLEGALGQKAEEVFNKLSKETQDILPTLLRMLVSISDDEDHKKTARKVELSMCEQNINLLLYVQAMLSQNVRLFVSNKEDSGKIYIRVTHEALFNNWERAKDIINNERSDIQLRDRLEKSALLWKNEKGNIKNKQSLLLHDGLPLNQAQDILKRRKDELESNIIEYIEESIEYTKKLKYRKKILYITLFLLSIIVSSIMLFLTVEANKQKDLAIVEKERADFKTQEAKNNLALYYIQKAKGYTKNNQHNEAYKFYVDTLKNLNLNDTRRSEIVSQMIKYPVYPLLYKYQLPLTNTKEQSKNIFLSENSNLKYTSFTFSPNSSSIALGDKRGVVTFLNIRDGNISSPKNYSQAILENNSTKNVTDAFVFIEIDDEEQNKENIVLSVEKSELMFHSLNNEFDLELEGREKELNIDNAFFLNKINMFALISNKNKKLFFVSEDDKNSTCEFNLKKTVQKLKSFQSNKQKIVIGITKEKELLGWNLDKKEKINIPDILKHNVKYISTQNSDIVVLASDTAIYTWNIKSNVVKTLHEYSKRLIKQIVLANGSLISITKDSLVNSWNLNSGELMSSISVENSMGNLKIYPVHDGVCLINIDKENISILEITDKSIETLHSITLNPYLEIIDSTISFDKSELALRYKDNSILFINLETMDKVHKNIKDNSIYSLAFSKDDSQIDIVYEKHLIQWNLKNNKQIIKQPLPNKTKSTVLSADRAMIAIINTDDDIKIFNHKEQKYLTTIYYKDSPYKSVKSVKFINNKELIVLGSDDSIEVWNIEENKKILTFNPQRQLKFSSFKDIAVSTFNNQLAIIEGNNIYIHQIERDFQNHLYIDPEILYNLSISSVDQSDSVNKIEFSDDGKYLAAITQENSLYIWNMVNQNKLFLKRNINHIDIKDILLAPENNELVIKTKANTINILHSANQDIKSSFKLYIPTKMVLNYTSDSKTIYGGSAGDTVQVYKYSKDFSEFIQNKKDILYDTTSMGTSTAFSPNGRLAATGTTSGSIHVWDLLTGKTIQYIYGHEKAVTCLKFSQDGNILASGSKDTNIILWDMKKYQKITTLTYHTAPISALAFTVDSNTLASASTDKTINLWELATYEKYSTLKGHKYEVTSLAFSSDAEKLLSIDVDAVVIGWDLKNNKKYIDKKLSKELNLAKVLTTAVSYFASKDLFFIGINNYLIYANIDSSLSIEEITQFAKNITDIACANNGKDAALVFEDKEIQLSGVSISDNNDIYFSDNFTSMSMPFSSHSFLVNNEMLILSEQDNTIRKINLNKSDEISIVYKKQKGEKVLGISPQGDIVASVLNNGNIKIWNLNTKKTILQIKKFNIEVENIKFSSSEIIALFFSPLYEQNIKLWDIAKNKEIIIDTKLSGDRIAFSHDAKLMAIRDGNVITLWDMINKKIVITIDTLYNNHFPFVFSDDDKKLIAQQSYDDLIYYDLTTMKRLLYDSDK